MGTILNTCKETRKQIKTIEKGIDETVVAWKRLENGHKEVAIYFEDKAEKIKGGVYELKGKLEAINTELEKDSKVRPYYDEVANKCDDFLKGINKNEESD